jgi:cysteine desulfurase family protein
MIYLDSAATSFHKPPQVAEAVYNAMMGMGNSGRGAHGASLFASRTVYHAREAISNIFNVGDPSKVVFTANATESLNIAIQGLIDEGDHCITTAIEHNSVLRPLYHMEKNGVALTIIPTDEKGCIDVCKIEKAIRPETKAVVVTHASNVTGNVMDIKKIGEICEAHDLLFILDVSQSAGLIPVDMQDIKISALCFSGHKSFLGPQGIGVLCLAQGVYPKPLKCGGTGIDSFSHTMPHAMPTALEAGTLNTHGIAGLLAACEYLNNYGQSKLLEEANELADMFIDGIKDLDGVSMYGDFEAELRTPVVSINVRDINSGEIADELFERFGIATRAGAHCAPEVHRAFNTVEQGMVRFSFCHFNTKDEVDLAINAVKVLLEESL